MLKAALFTWSGKSDSCYNVPWLCSACCMKQTLWRAQTMHLHKCDLRQIFTRTFSKNGCSLDSRALHAICRCQLKLYHAKSKPFVNMVQKRCRVLWTRAYLKWTISKWKSVLWSDESKFDILVGNHRHLEITRETFQHVISDGMGVHKCIQYGQLAWFGRHYECWNVYRF